MNIFGKMWAAFGRVIAAADALADTLEEANVNVRHNLALDAPAAPALPGPVGDDAPAPKAPKKAGGKG